MLTIDAVKDPRPLALRSPTALRLPFLTAFSLRPKQNSCTCVRIHTKAATFTHFRAAPNCGCFYCLLAEAKTSGQLSQPLQLVHPSSHWGCYYFTVAAKEKPTGSSTTWHHMAAVAATQINNSQRTYPRAVHPTDTS